jgi:hypothetical protein
VWRAIIAASFIIPVKLAFKGDDNDRGRQEGKTGRGRRSQGTSVLFL